MDFRTWQVTAPFLKKEIMELDWWLTPTNVTLRKGETGGSGVQGRPWLYESLRPMLHETLFQKKKKKRKRKKGKERKEAW